MSAAAPEVVGRRSGPRRLRAPRKPPRGETGDGDVRDGATYREPHRTFVASSGRLIRRDDDQLIGATTDPRVANSPRDVGCRAGRHQCVDCPRQRRIVSGELTPVGRYGARRRSSARARSGGWTRGPADGGTRAAQPRGVAVERAHAGRDVHDERHPPGPPRQRRTRNGCDDREHEHGLEEHEPMPAHAADRQRHRVPCDRPRPQVHVAHQPPDTGALAPGQQQDDRDEEQQPAGPPGSSTPWRLPVLATSPARRQAWSKVVERWPTTRRAPTAGRATHRTHRAPHTRGRGCPCRPRARPRPRRAADRRGLRDRSTRSPPRSRDATPRREDLHDCRDETAIEQEAQPLERARRLEEVGQHDDEPPAARRGAVVDERSIDARSGRQRVAARSVSNTRNSCGRPEAGSTCARIVSSNVATPTASRRSIAT